MNENETGSWADQIPEGDPFANTEEPVETPDEVFDIEKPPTYSEHMMPAVRRERAARRDRLDSDSGPAWDENDALDPLTRAKRVRVRAVVDIDTLDDGRCKASSWRPKRPAKPTYENHFGPGGFNRCIGSEGHANPTHKDEWGNVFQATPFHVLRTEPREDAR